ncbi:MAG: KamA family radical SAM protein [Candidatus Zixiibacteriota bacterium]
MAKVERLSSYNLEVLREAAGEAFARISGVVELEVARERLHRQITTNELDTYAVEATLFEGRIVRVRDCSRTLKSIIKQRSDKLADFSVMQALHDIARDVPRSDLQEGFYAEMYHLFLGMKGEGPGTAPGDFLISPELEGREAATARSTELDKLWEDIEKQMSRFRHGLEEKVIEYRRKRREKVLSQLGGNASDWDDWGWHLTNVIKKPTQLNDLIPLSKSEKGGLKLAEEARLPFGITPYYLSLMDENRKRRDRAVRAQVIPSAVYVECMATNRGKPHCSFDFMLERDTSPIDLVTRRYPAIVILKPYNACPQICVYCQRNWEIDEALAPGALASDEKIMEAITWIRDHPSIHEVLVTGGDPLALGDEKLFWILEEVAEIPSVERMRIGTRTLVTLPMRITDQVAEFLGKLRKPMQLEVSVITHVEHPYEITPEMFRAVERLRRQSINVYNQNVYTFFLSRRFEAAALRRTLKRVGIEPYYTFNTKGKDETVDYRVPIARLLQEQKEEARLLPGLCRTDEAVYNLPALGKNYLRAYQHRDVISVLPDGSRVYEFHPWEKNIKHQKSYVGVDVPILDYLLKLKKLGENISQYETIWYYF